jgi:hypothetical protein
MNELQILSNILICAQIIAIDLTVILILIAAKYVAGKW